MKKTTTVMFLTALTILSSVPAVEAATDTNIISVTASAASQDDVTNSQIDTIESRWYNYGYVVKRNFYVNSMTKQVNKDVQFLLNLTNNAQLEEDGVIGNLSVAAIKNYQRSRGLTVDGIVGNATMRSLLSEARVYANFAEMSPVQQYDLSAALSYAGKYWNKRNTAYNYYSGNNCANFVSQCLVAAGLPTDNTWKNGSYAFVNVDGLKSYFRSQYGVTYKSWPSASDIKVGDVIYTNNGGHVMFVVKKSGGKIYASGNTNNRNALQVSTSCISGVLKTSALF